MIFCKHTRGGGQSCNSTAKYSDAWKLKVVKTKLSTACVSLAGRVQEDAWEQTKECMHGINYNTYACLLSSVQAAAQEDHV